MSIANNRLTSHRQPKITRLLEGRLQVERWFRIEADVDPKGDSRLTARIFGGYGLLDGTTDTTFEKTEFPDSAFADCRLIEENTDEQFTQSGKSFHILYQKYQTLTAEWALKDEDKEAGEKNGLRTLTRQEVALASSAAPYDEDDVGVETITSAGKTLYLAGFKDNSNESMGEFVSQWVEPGILSVRTPKVGGQQRSRQTTSLLTYRRVITKGSRLLTTLSRWMTSRCLARLRTGYSE